MSSQEEEAGRRNNFDQLHYVYYQAAPNFFRRVFYELWEAVEGTKWEDDKVNGMKLMSVKGLLVIVKGGKLQKKNVESGNSLLWDLSLLADILGVLKKENPQVTLQSYDIAVFTKKNLEWLKSTRNKLAHAGTIEIDSATFQPLWDETDRILTCMGMARQLLERLDKFVGNTHPPESTKAAKKAEIFKESGNTLFKDGDIYAAAVKYSKAIDLDEVPQELLGTLYANRSSAFLKMGDPEAAKDDAKSAITLRPNWFKGYTRLGQAYEKAQKFPKAAFNFLLAVHLGDSSEKTKDSIEYCNMMIHKLSRSEATDPEIMRQKELRYTQSKRVISSFMEEKLLEKFYEGTPLHLCQMAHRYYFGRDECPQDFEMAADYFAKAASLGDPEGLYNLGRMTQEGKGVPRDVFKGHQLILKAAKMSTTAEYVPGSGMKFRHIGVMEAWHQLGMAYDFGVAVSVDKKEALKWYLKAVEFGSGMLANNIACIYEGGMLEDFPVAVDFWKLSSHLKTARAAENLANAYWRLGEFQLAQEWYHYAIHMGSIDMPLSREKDVHDLSLEKSFDGEEFRLRVETDLRTSERMSSVLKKIEDNLRDLVDGMGWLDNKQAKLPEAGGKAEAIRDHRRFQKESRLQLKKCLDWTHWTPWTVPASLLPTSSGVDLTGLKEILFKELNAEIEDKVFTGRALKVEVIEDAVIGLMASIYLLVEDANGDVGRLFVYNYPKRNKTQEELGYGCRLTLIHPHYRTMDDKKRGIRIDDPQLIFRHDHLRNPKRCRYCGKAEGGIKTCRKCRRVTYCSKLCLQEYEKVLEHSLVCVKSLDKFIKE